MALRRVSKELPEVCGPHWQVVEAQGLVWTVRLLGPPCSVYYGGVFTLRVEFPAAYPFRPPQFRFTSQIYNPFIDAQGSVCMHFQSWSPALRMEHVLGNLLSLLSNPNPGDQERSGFCSCVLNTGASEQWRGDRHNFDELAWHSARQTAALRWSPEIHVRMPSVFQRRVRTFALLAARLGVPQCLGVTVVGYL
eukprot:NODE_5154_length_692_cov_28.238938_g4991_i0.p1 GENE.NODE_5154_length_692_cov_28.238938_g4991_i0~~NODE_5154_length_692_cov_28.238938_g4991_i0.p1  ORF type:complete len:223 (+),score=24.74 NODE_5154_length_692_cov_28.238938_g4991_i0:93-671(+)